MLKFRRIEIENFVLFDSLDIEPSTDPKRPLTIVRAENGSGKTTLLRAIRWGMYGERGLPGDRQRFGVQPASWKIGDNPVRTRVSLEFETDGSNRHDHHGKPTITAYLLTRSVTTIGRPVPDSRRTDFYRSDEQTQLMIQERGTWAPYTEGVDTVVEKLLPFGLRDFFVMDADEATDFVGGSENKVMPHTDVVRKTTDAVRSLLGIDVFRDAAQRISKTAQEFGRRATRAIGDAQLDDLQKEHDALVVSREQLKENLVQSRKERAEIRDSLDAVKHELETQIKQVGAKDQLQPRREENEIRTNAVLTEREKCASMLSGLLESVDLLASLTVGKLSKAWNVLMPLYQAGHIPVAHLNFVRELLRSNKCVCGANLSRGTGARGYVEERLEQSAAEEQRANYLAQLYDACQELHGYATHAKWQQKRKTLEQRLGALDRDLSKLDLVKQDIEKKLGEIDDSKLQTCRDQEAMLQKQDKNLDRKIIVHEGELNEIDKQIDSKKKILDHRRRTKSAAQHDQRAQIIAELVASTLKSAYERIQIAQVRDLSKRMDQMFHSMAANTSDEDLANVQQDKATLRMIDRVGLRTVEGRPGDYEIYALNMHGRSMPPIEINGASRRVLALAFVLALCVESGTKAPLVADSMLNFMSGMVRRNTFRVTAKNARQPILLLTNSDLAAASEVETVEQYGGATYTLTPQWREAGAAKEGDVIRIPTPRLVSLVCKCGPRQYCDTCERIGQARLPDWRSRS